VREEYRYNGEESSRSSYYHQRETFADLFMDLTEDAQTLFREELALAKAEMSKKATRLSKDMVMIVVGGLLAHIGLLALVGAAVTGLALEMDLWLASLIVGVVLLVFGGVFVMAKVNSIKKQSMIPERSAASLEEDRRWVKQEMR
jgi:hypothetical protein